MIHWGGGREMISVLSKRKPSSLELDENEVLKIHRLMFLVPQASRSICFLKQRELRLGLIYSVNKYLLMVYCVSHMW